MRHPNSERFHELLRECGEMHDRKQADYGSDSDPFANVRAASEWGLPGWVGAMVRVNDKVRRLQAFARKGELANESAEDSFLDIAVYALIAHVLYSEAGPGDENPFNGPGVSLAVLPKATCEKCGQTVAHALVHFQPKADGEVWTCQIVTPRQRAMGVDDEAARNTLERASEWPSRGRCGHHTDGVGRCDLHHLHPGPHRKVTAAGNVEWSTR